MSFFRPGHSVDKLSTLWQPIVISVFFRPKIWVLGSWSWGLRRGPHPRSRGVWTGAGDR